MRYSFFSAATLRRILPLLLLIIGGAPLAAELLPYGSMTPLEPKAEVDRWWPDSMRVVGVAHVGRHGARYLSSDKKVADVRRHLDAARRRGTLTPQGERACAILDTVCRATGPDWGMLTALGFRQEHLIGHQMTALAPQLYRTGGAVAIATTVPRVVQTMYALCSTLARASEKQSIVAADSPSFDPLLRFFESDSAYVGYLHDGRWRATYDDFCRRTIPLRPATALVGETDADAARDLTMALYAVMQGMPAAALDISPDVWFTPAEMQACAAVSNLRHYLQRCANPDGAEPARAAVPLLRDILRALENPADSVSLRFGHAETLLPLFSLMGLPGCDDPRLAPDDVARSFDVGAISPLGANLQLYVLAAPSGRRYVAALLNGVPVPPAPGADAVMPLDEFHLAMHTRIDAIE